MNLGGTPDESFFATWGRRAITIPAMTMTWMLAVLISPAALPLAAMFDLLTNRRFPVTRTLCMFLVYLTVEVVGIARSFATWLRWVAIHRSRERFIEDNYRLQHWWAMTLYRWAVRLFSLRLETDEAGLGVPRQSIIFVRHVCIFDNLVPFVTMTDGHGIRMRWAINRFLLRDPCLDIVGNRLPNTFVRNDRTDGSKQVSKVVGLLEGMGEREGVQMFPEGALFNPGRRERSLKRLQDRGEHLLYERMKQLRGTLPPRMGGTLGLLEANPGADAVFISHTGLEAAGSYGAILGGALVGKTLRVKLWQVPFADIPVGIEKRQSWFLDEWEEVDRFVQEQTELPVIAAAAASVG